LFGFGRGFDTRGQETQGRDGANSRAGVPRRSCHGICALDIISMGFLWLNPERAKKFAGCG
jgi:hypothetical protein